MLPNMIKKILLQSALSLAISLLTVIFVYGGYVIYAANGNYYFQQTNFFAETKFAYHIAMNDFFNGKIEHLVELLDQKDGLASKDLQAPSCSLNDSTAECRAKCGENNVSSYCVGVEGMEIYLKYLNKLRNVADSTNALNDITALDSALTVIGARNEAINEEVENAQRALETTLTAYDEFKTAYPLHKQYKALTLDLLRYKAKLKDIRQEVTFFPLEFNNVTSETCR